MADESSSAAIAFGFLARSVHGSADLAAASVRLFWLAETHALAIIICRRRSNQNAHELNFWAIQAARTAPNGFKRLIYWLITNRLHSKRSRWFCLLSNAPAVCCAISPPLWCIFFSRFSSRISFRFLWPAAPTGLNLCVAHINMARY